MSNSRFFPHSFFSSFSIFWIYCCSRSYHSIIINSNSFDSFRFARNECEKRMFRLVRSFDKNASQWCAVRISFFGQCDLWKVNTISRPLRCFTSFWAIKGIHCVNYLRIFQTNARECEQPWTIPWIYDWAFKLAAHFKRNRRRQQK